MSQPKKPIDLLEEAKKHYVGNNKNVPPYYCCPAKVNRLVDQALALLSEPAPEAGEFTKEVRREVELVSTDDLIKELANRHTELIVIREHKKKKNEDNVFVKTGFGEKGRQEKGFDLVAATTMLHAAHYQLIHDYLDDVDDKKAT